MSPAERRAAIVDATVPLLREHGAALTTKQVAEAAGIAEGTVFRAFGTKDDLVRACAAAVFDPTEVVARLREVPRGLPLDERLAAGVAVVAAHLERAIGLVVALHASGEAHPGRGGGLPKRRTASDPEVDAALVDLVGEDADALRLPVVDVVHVLVQLTLASAHPMFPVRAMTPEEIVSVVLDGTRATR